jgi:hypothetical protein
MPDGCNSCLKRYYRSARVWTRDIRFGANLEQSLVGWPSWLWRQVKVHLNDQYPGSETSVGSSPTPITIFFCRHWKIMNSERHLRSAPSVGTSIQMSKVLRTTVAFHHDI